MKFVSLHDRLRGPVATTLREKLHVQNVHALPRIQKVTVNVGINRSKMEGKEVLEYIEESLKKITGQKPAFRTAKKAISNFKIREGLVVGAMVTLRGRRMEAFLDKLFHVALPRVRDFRGVTSKLDGQGNYSIGLKEHTVFPEVPPPADAAKIFGLQITLTTTAETDQAAKALLDAIGVPFRKEKESDPIRKKHAEKEG
jgi:large subunit ribosomal protein L5